MNQFSNLFGNTKNTIKLLSISGFILSLFGAIVPFIFLFILAFELKIESSAKILSIIFDSRHLSSIFNSLILAISVSIFVTLLSSIIALFFRKINLTGNRIIYGLAIIPVFIPDQIFGIAGRIIFDPTIGLLSEYNTSILIDRYSSLLLISFFVILKWTPLMIVLCDATISAIPTDEYYQTIMDHNSFFKQTRYTYFPSLKGILVLIFSIVFLTGFRQHELAYELTSSGGGFISETWSLWNYKEIFEFVKFGEAAIEAITILVLLLIPINIIKNQAQRLL